MANYLRLKRELWNSHYIEQRYRLSLTTRH